MLGLLGHTTCVFVSDHDCHDDPNDPHHCDDHHNDVFGGPDQSPRGSVSPAHSRSDDAVDELRLRICEVVPSTDLRAHPIRKVVQIEGISLPGSAGPRGYSEERLQEFTARVLSENEDLIGLPALSGRLRFSHVQFLTRTIRVTYQQERQSFSAVPGRVSGARMTFVFDRVGNLLEIDNTTRIDLD